MKRKLTKRGRMKRGLMKQWTLAKSGEAASMRYLDHVA
jgi:hypothetical protein